MRKLLLMSAAFCLASVVREECAACYYAAHSLYDVRGYFEQIVDSKDKERNTLVLFDGDNVILRRNRHYSNVNLDEYVELYRDKNDPDSSAKINKVLNNKELVDPEWPDYIKGLQDRGIKVMLLSAYKTDAAAACERYNELQSSGIDFYAQWKDVAAHYVTDHSDEVWGRPMFWAGMLLTGNCPKGVVLSEFLKAHPEYKFKRIIFIDDHDPNLKNVGNAVQNNLYYHCILYNQVEKGDF
ncbi:hypothetical protein FACS189472_04920 [Alphaproteobacteria bacterium]|nr:hypothetical protein FACS189472_04920 [Alphaproteobacteria bacterium]